MSKKYRYISLFSGCGGFDLGFGNKAFECVGAFDFDPHVEKVFRHNIGNHFYLHDLNNSELPIEDKVVDLIVSGSPCQGFSTIGRRKLLDPRNELLIQGGRIAIKYGARLFVAENVPGSNAGKHKKYWNKLITLLEANDYTTRLEKYNAHDYGVAQSRNRMILYAWKGRINANVVFHNPVPEKDRKALKDVLTNLRGLPNHTPVNLDPTTPDFEIARVIKPKQKLSNVRGGSRAVHTWSIPAVFGEVTQMEEQLLIFIMKQRRRKLIRKRENGDADPLSINYICENFKDQKDVNSLIDTLVVKGYLRRIGKNHVDLKDAFNGKYKRMSLQDPSFTVDTRFCDPKYFLHPMHNRGFTIREAARIQGFADDFLFEGPLNKQIQMIGNAVPPRLAAHVASVCKQILDKTDYQ